MVIKTRHFVSENCSKLYKLWNKYLKLMTFRQALITYWCPGGEMAQTSAEGSCRRWVVAGRLGPCSSSGVDGVCGRPP